MWLPRAFLALHFTVACASSHLHKDEMCANVLETLKHVCHRPENMCACNATALRQNTSFAVLISGHLRSFYATHHSLQAYILRPNQAPHVFMFVRHRVGNILDAMALQHAKEIATVLVSEEAMQDPSRSVVDIVKNHFHRPVQPLHEKLDEHQNKKVNAAIERQWEGVTNAFRLVDRASQLIGKNYSLVVRSRTDLAFFQPLHLNRLQNTNYAFGLIDPAFFPDCGKAGGVNDQFFVATQAHMRILTREYWPIDMISVNFTAAEEAVPGVSHFLWFNVGWGTEGLLKGWALLNRIPLFEIPNKAGDDGILYGILRPGFVSRYCNHDFQHQANWADAGCVVNKGGDEAKALVPLGPSFIEFCDLWENHMKKFCMPLWTEGGRLIALPGETEEMYEARRKEEKNRGIARC